MDFAFTQDQETLRGHLKDLLDEVCTPEYAARCDDEATPPREAYNALAKNGWFGLIIPQEYGGTGGSAIDLAILLEEAGRHFEELAMWLFRTLTYGGYAVMLHGTKQQKEFFLPKVLKGELSLCFGLTDLFMNAEAVALEHDLKRPVFMTFHGGVSAGVGVMAVASSWLAINLGTGSVAAVAASVSRNPISSCAR